jgi:excisionase family DNA binding protein
MLIGTAEAARLVGCHRDSIRHMINQGKLKAQKVGRDWLIEETDLETVKEAPTMGRPRRGTVEKIEIRTRFAEGIASVGGTTVTYFTWTIGPRNLMKAIETLPDHSRSMTDGYGNVGHAGSWITVAGVEMTADDIREFEHETESHELESLSAQTSKTEWCKNFIASVLDGSLVEQRREDAEWRKANDAAYDAGLDAGRDGKPKPAGHNGHEYELERGYRDGCQDRAEVND